MTLVSDHVQPLELGILKRIRKQGVEVYLCEIGDKSTREWEFCTLLEDEKNLLETSCKFYDHGRLIVTVTIASLDECSFLLFE